MNTRRCSERRFFLRPDPQTNNAFLYCLALAANVYRVQVMFTATMSNHHHTGIIDVHGRLPEFLAYFHKLVAKHQNALRGRWEAMWASEQTSVVELVDDDDVIAKMVYALSNPVKDFLIEKAHHWPGVSSLGAIVANRPMTATKPKTFFRPDSALPDAVSLSFHLPRGLQELPRGEFAARLQERITAVERQAAAERARSGKRIVGRRGVLDQHWSDSPRSREPRRQMSPRVACQNLWRRIETLGRNKAWLEAYREARAAFLAGASACFPAGTFWLKRHAGVACEPFASD